MQQRDVEVLRLGRSAQLVDLLLRIDSVVGRNLGHQAIAVAGNTLESYTEHLVHATVGLGSFEEADTALMGMTHQPGELILAQVALGLAGKGSRAECEPRDLNVCLSQGYPIGRSLRFGLQRKSSGGGEGARSEACLQEITSGVMSHELPPIGRILPYMVGPVPRLTVRRGTLAAS